MHDWTSLSHVRWDCKYHVVIVPKYRKKALYGRLRRQVGDIIKDLCRQRQVELLEGHLMADHVDPSSNHGPSEGNRYAILGSRILCEHRWYG